MKKYWLLFLIGFVIILSGCGANTKTSINSNKEVKKTANTIFDCLNNDDCETMKELFCESSRESSTLDEQITEAFDFFDGKIVSHDSLEGIGTSGKTVENGEITKLDASPFIQHIKTDSNKEYEIRFYQYIINDEFPEKVGVSEISIKEVHGEEIIIGEYVD